MFGVLHHFPISYLQRIKEMEFLELQKRDKVIEKGEK